MTILSFCLATVFITNVADLASNCRAYRLGERFDLTVTAVEYVVLEDERRCRIVRSAARIDVRGNAVSAVT